MAALRALFAQRIIQTTEAALAFGIARRTLRNIEAQCSRGDTELQPGEAVSPAALSGARIEFSVQEVRGAVAVASIWLALLLLMIVSGVMTFASSMGTQLVLPE